MYYLVSDWCGFETEIGRDIHMSGGSDAVRTAHVQHSQEAPDEIVNNDGIQNVMVNELLCFVYN